MNIVLGGNVSLLDLREEAPKSAHSPHPGSLRDKMASKTEAHACRELLRAYA